MMEKKFNKDCSFQPKILPKSKEISLTRSQRSRSRPWAPDSQSCKDSLLANVTARGSNRDLVQVGQFTRPSSRGAASLANSFAKLDLGGGVKGSTMVTQPPQYD